MLSALHKYAQTEVIILLTQKIGLPPQLHDHLYMELYKVPFLTLQERLRN